MRAALDDARLVHDEDLIRFENRAEAMRDHKAGAAGQQWLERAEHAYETKDAIEFALSWNQE